MAQLDFTVEAIEPVTVTGPDAIQGAALMSPYVWATEAGFGLLVRVVPPTGSAAPNTGTIYYGESADGLHFTLDATPVIAPGPDALDIGGCEDPTLVLEPGRAIVYYTGVDASMSSGQMLMAVGPDVRHLSKAGVALASSKSEGNVKEATIDRTEDGHWRLFYEFARDNASLVGLAIGDDVGGPWHSRPQPFAPREGNWDSWHLSTGPLLTTDKDMPVMFYNGATQDARWRIGWVAFDADYTKVVDRCIEPLIAPPPQPDRTAADIAFAASMVAEGDQITLYYSLADARLERAHIRRFRY